MAIITMLIPESVPGLKWIVIMWAAITVAWVVLEDNLGWTAAGLIAGLGLGLLLRAISKP